MRTRTVGLLAALVLVGAAMAPAHADSVQVTSDPGSSADGVFITYVGCESFFAPATAPTSRVNLGPGAAPMGRRSLGLVPQGTGTAAGPIVRFGSLVGLHADMSVHSSGGARGVSYVWVVTKDAPPGHAWSGRAEVNASAGWQRVDATSLTYAWSLVDLATRRVTETGASATTGAFAATHGDGAGYVVTGLGCDGRGFNLDAVRGQATVLDFEGLSLSTTLEGPATTTAGERVTISGTVRDGERITGDPLVLQARAPGGEWRSIGEPALADADGVTRVEVMVEQTTDYRWLRPESEYADEGFSEPHTVTVAPTPAQSSSPAPSPAPSKSEKPNGKLSDKAGAKPGGKAGEKASEKPGDKAGEKASEKRKPGDKAGEKASEKPGDKAGEKKPGDKPGDKAGEKPSDKPSGEPGAGTVAESGETSPQ